jgi:peptidoglycan hydrolase FlgJ
MDVQAIQNGSSGTAAPWPGSDASGQQFSNALGASATATALATAGVTGSSASAAQDKAHKAAQDLVAVTLFQPMLKQMHEDPFRVAMFHGGQGEEAFQQQLDGVLAQRMTQKANPPIVNAIYQSLMKAQARRAGGLSSNRGVDLHG